MTQEYDTCRVIRRRVRILNTDPKLLGGCILLLIVPIKGPMRPIAALAFTLVDIAVFLIVRRLCLHDPERLKIIDATRRLKDEYDPAKRKPFRWRLEG